MKLRCPECRHENQTDDVSKDSSVRCESCGTNFVCFAETLIAETTVEGEDGASRKLAQAVGHFELIRLLGQGSFGAVWLARDTDLDRQVAVKIPRKGGLTEEEREQFLREARAAGQLRHENIVPIHQVGSDAESVYIVSEFIQGTSLAEWLLDQRPSAKEAARLCIAIAKGLEHAHQQGVIHRDLKPGNIMMDLEGRPHIMDFGLARRETGEATVTIDGQILGTPAYMSPEQARGESHRADSRSDVYSLGVILFQLLTGEVPFRGSMRALIVQIVGDDPPRPRRLQSEVPIDLETICLKCLEKEPARRYQSADEVANELECFLEGVPILARPIGRVGRFWRWCRRRPALASLSVALVVVTIVGFVAVFSQWRRAETNFVESQTNLTNANREWQRAEDNYEQSQIYLADANREWQRAEDNYGLARETIERLLTVVPNHELVQSPGMEPIKLSVQGLACEYYQRLADQSPDDFRIRSDQARAHFYLAYTLEDVGNFAEALNQYQLAKTAFEQAHQVGLDHEADQPFLLSTLQNMAACSGNMVYVKEVLGESVDSMSTFEEMLAIQRQMVDQQPGAVQPQVGVGNTLLNIGTVARDERDFEVALTWFLQADEVASALIAEHPDNVDVIMLQAGVDVELGNATGWLGDYETSLAAYRRAEVSLDRLVNQHPERLEFQNLLAITYTGLAGDYDLMEDFELADHYWQKVVATRASMNELAPEVFEYRQKLMRCYSNVSLFKRDRGEPFAAAEYLIEQRRLLDADDFTTRFDVACRFGECVLMIDGRDELTPEQLVQREEIVEELLATLRTAIDAGFRDLDQLNNDPRLEAIRQRPEFAEISEALAP